MPYIYIYVYIYILESACALRAHLILLPAAADSRPIDFLPVQELLRRQLRHGMLGLVMLGVRQHVKTPKLKHRGNASLLTRENLGNLQCGHVV